MTVGLTRWNSTPDYFPRRFGQFIDRFFDESAMPTFGPETAGRRSWAPPVDIRETDQGLVLTAELPGLTKEDVHLSIEDNVLTLSGERKFEKDVEEENYHRIERTYGTFARSFTLPSQFRTDAVEAKFENGILTVALPKAEEARPRKIEIR